MTEAYKWRRNVIRSKGHSGNILPVHIIVKYKVINYDYYMV